MSLFDEIRDQARADRAAEEAAGKSEAQAAASLEKKGVDVDAARAKLEAAIARTTPPRKRRAGPLAAVFALGVGTVGLAEGVLVAAGALEMSFGPAHAPTAPTFATAAAPHGLRDDAFRAFERGDCAAALRAFDDARRVDPAGDEEAAVVAVRSACLRALRDAGGSR